MYMELMMGPVAHAVLKAEESDWDRFLYII